MKITLKHNKYLQFVRASTSLLILSVFAATVLSQAVAQAAPTPKTYSDSVLQVKLRTGSALSVQGSQLAGSDATSLQTSIGFKPKSVKRMFGGNVKALDAQYQSLRTSGVSVPRLSQYVQIDLGKRANTKAIAAKLKTLPSVEEAYPAPLPPPAPASPNLLSAQGYRASAPSGVDATFAASWPAGQGDGVRIIDIEYSWNTQHEDLAKARAAGALIAVNTPTDPFNNTSHGTAVLGILSASSNGYGVTGLVPNATIGMANAASIEYGWDPAGAIYAAATTLSAGDVILLEQQAWGPDGTSLVPVEWIPAVYDAIRYATAKNIIVVEAAANSGKNLGDAAVYGTTFPMGKQSSGAFIVGAGAACNDGTPVRSRLSFSNYGPRVDFQGWGNCVTTTGFGDAYAGSADALYTNAFNGTSSASPMVASAVASFVASYKKLNGAAPTAAVVRNALLTTGTPQNFATGALTGSIGPLPNMAKALLLTDTKAPAVPTSLAVKLNSSNKPVLTWKAPADNVKTTGYQLYRNDVLIKTLPVSTTYTDTSTSSKKSYTYKLRAIDASGNASASTAGVKITTK